MKDIPASISLELAIAQYNNCMKTTVIMIVLLVILSTLLFIDVYLRLIPNSSTSMVSPISNALEQIKDKPLEKYSFPNLKARTAQASEIKLESVLFEDPQYTAYLFSFITEDHRMTGQLNVPKTATPSAGFPVILMIRGYVDKATYQTGLGTKPAAAVYAKNGFVTVAPDYFGHGGSDDPPISVMGERVRRPLNTLDLIASLNSLSFVDHDRLGLWGHSNGGQLALSILEITGRPLPTTLWAPVTKPFPFSILFFTDEHSDQGKALRKTVATFETDYDVFDYSIDRHISDITAPIQLHQGTNDEAVPYRWSSDFVQSMKKIDKDIVFYTYSNADHNLRPGWDTVVARDLDFFAAKL
jgi:uncharacterized protein